MKKFLLNTPDPTDACSWYRGVGPFSQLHRNGWEMVRCPTTVDWASISLGCQVAIMQRPFSPVHVQVANILKRQMPLVLDFDDDFMAVPLANPAYEPFSHPAVQEALKVLLELADCVMVSTQPLADKLAPLTRRVEVVVNAYNDYLLPMDRPKQARERTILWRGSQTHDEDLLAFSDEIVQVAKDNPTWRFVFLGARPWVLQGRMQAEWSASMGIFEMHELLRDDLRPGIVQVPLMDNAFNRAKSNVAWIEATMAKALCVMPEFIEAQGSLSYTPGSYEQQLRRAIALYERGQPLRQLDSAIMAVPLLSKVNLTRKAILESLT
jgi:hypothetical protein